MFHLLLIVSLFISISRAGIIQPVVFIIPYKENGEGKVSYESIVNQVKMLNSAYSSADAIKGRYAKPTDTKVRFKLAGVRYTKNDKYHDLCALPSTMAVMRPLLQSPPASHLNVYVCWCKYMLGAAFLPTDYWFRKPMDENHYAHGPIIHHELLPGNTFKKGLWSQGKILVHEIGHSYGLRHPYDGGCLGPDVDGIADTPRMSGNPLQQCGAVRNKNTCPNHPGRDDLSNYMVATADSCRNHFTPGQVAAIQKNLEKYKPTLWKQETLPNCIAAVSSTDSAPDLEPCVSPITVTKGKKWCLTDRSDSRKWAWACCPTNMTWSVDVCIQQSGEQPRFTYSILKRPT